MKKGFVKNLTSVFRRYENKYLSLKKRFVTPDKKSDRFIYKYYRVHSRNSIQMLMHPIETMDIAYSKYDVQADAILMFIKEFTNHNEISNEQIAEFGEALMKDSHLKIAKIDYKDRDSCTITLENGREIYFQTISSSFSNVLEMFPDLLSGDRERKCHMRSLALTYAISQPTNCVTGSIWSLSPKAKWLHSWVEMEFGDKMWCIDNNMNTVMEKADYYYLMHPRILESISNKTIKEDCDVIDYLSARLTEETPYIKLYCASRDEAIEKYKELLSKDEEREIE